MHKNENIRHAQYEKLSGDSSVTNENEKMFSDHGIFLSMRQPIMFCTHAYTRTADYATNCLTGNGK